MDRTPHFTGRLAAEFAVIVIGVLVALAADGWRAEREDRAAVRETLVGIEDELVSDSSALAGAVRLTGRQMAAAEQVIRLSNGEGRVGPDSLSALLETASRSGPLVLSDGSYVSLLSARGLDVIGDAELRRQLTEYYESHHGLLRDIRRVAIENVVVDDFLPLLHRHTMPWLEPNSSVFRGDTRPRLRLETPVNEVLADRELMSGVAKVMEYLWYYQVALDLAVADNSGALTDVREFLAR